MTPTELVLHLRSLQGKQEPFDSLAFYEAVDDMTTGRADLNKSLTERYLQKVKEKNAKQD